MEDEQHQSDGSGARASADQVGAINPRRILSESSQREADGCRRAEERNVEEKVENEEKPQLPAAPNDLQLVEFDSLRDQECPDRGQREACRSSRGHRRKSRQQPISQQREKRSAHAVTEESETDHQKCEVVPIDDRKESDQKNLVRQRAAREER